MVATANTVNCGSKVRFTAVAAHASGDLVQQPDGRASVVDTARSLAIGDVNAGAAISGRWSILKTASMVFIYGSRVYFDRATGLATLRPGVGRYYIGTAAKDAAAADERVDVFLNEQQRNVTELGRWGDGEGFTNSDALGSGSVFGEGTVTLAFDAVAEVARAAIISNMGVDADDGPIGEIELAVFDIGNNAALDINFGLASEAHATDFDAAAAYVAVHLDSPSLSLLIQSDDTAAAVAAFDSTVDTVDDQYDLYQFDCRDKANCKIYRNGVHLTGATLHLNAYTGTLYLVVHLEKTSDDTLADVRVRAARLRTTDVVTAQ
jgi:predicted RecA/RadA family phage recombinase